MLWSAGLLVAALALSQVGAAAAGAADVAGTPSAASPKGLDSYDKVCEQLLAKTDRPMSCACM